MAEDAEEKYEVKVKGPGIAADKNVALPKALAVLQIIFGQEFSPTSVSVAGGGLASLAISASRANDKSRGQRLSVREFLAQAAGKSIPAKIATIGRFMRDHEGLNDFSRDDIKSRFRSAGEQMPRNYPRDFQKAIQAGWIGEDPQNRSRFYLTRTGDEAIDRKFEGPPVPAARNRRRRRPDANEVESEP
jgi:hypothetical protein